jgi:hypothetical protein
MSTRVVWLAASLAMVSAAPLNAQIGDVVSGDRRGPRVGVGVVVTVPARSDRDWRDECRFDRRGDRRDGDYRDDRDRGRDDRNDRDRGRDDYRDRDHDWYDRDGRWDCGDVGRRDGYGVGIAARTGLARQHADLQLHLDREHDRWHRSHGWYPRNRGWVRAHEALHERLEREHERWHRSRGIGFIYWPDRLGPAGRPGHASGVAHF